MLSLICSGVLSFWSAAPTPGMQPSASFSTRARVELPDGETVPGAYLSMLYGRGGFLRNEAFHLRPETYDVPQANGTFRSTFHTEPGRRDGLPVPGTADRFTLETEVDHSGLEAALDRGASPRLFFQFSSRDAGLRTLEVRCNRN